MAAHGTVKAWQTPQVHRNDWLAAEIYPDSDDLENASGNLQNGPEGPINPQGGRRDERYVDGHERHDVHD